MPRETCLLLLKSCSLLVSRSLIQHITNFQVVSTGWSTNYFFDWKKKPPKNLWTITMDDKCWGIYLHHHYKGHCNTQSCLSATPMIPVLPVRYHSQYPWAPCNCLLFTGEKIAWEITCSVHFALPLRPQATPTPSRYLGSNAIPSSPRLPQSIQQRRTPPP